MQSTARRRTGHRCQLLLRRCWEPLGKWGLTGVGVRLAPLHVFGDWRRCRERVVLRRVFKGRV